MNHTLVQESEVTIFEMLWLRSRADRNITHVRRTGEGKLFIYMGLAGGGEEMFFIPSEDEIRKELCL